MKKIFYFVFILFCLTKNIYSFETLTQAVDFTKKFEEYPESLSENKINPDYSEFYYNNKPSWLENLLYNFFNYFNLSTFTFWSAQEFKNLLLKVTKERQENSLTGNFIQSFMPNINSKFIIWGSLHGSLHSFVRALQKLKDLNIIDNDFKIIKSNYYIIFNGNSIDQSAYILETLTIILKIMDINKNKVFYIKGSHEKDEMWQNYGLKSELQIKCERISKEKIPLSTEINSFFETLPLGLYLKINQTEFVRISFWGRDSSLIDEALYTNFFNDINSDSVKNFKTEFGKKSDKTIDVKAIIKGKDIYTSSYEATEGLKLLPPDKGTTAWNIFSCPNAVYKSVYEFIHDAFVILTVIKENDDWYLTLYNQDTNTKTGFKTKNFNLFSGQKIPIITELKKTETIVLGTSLDLSKTLGHDNTPLLEGMNLKIQKENESGTFSKKIKLIALDNKYKAKQTIQNANDFINKHNTNIIVTVFGSAPSIALIPYILEKKILVLAPYTGALELRSPRLKNIILFKTSYVNESKALTNYIIKNLNSKKIAIFYQNDAFGKNCLDGAIKILTDNNYKKWLEVNYNVNDNNSIKIAAKKINLYLPDIIIFFSAEKQSIQLVDLLDKKLQEKVKYAGVSILGLPFKKYLNSKGFKYIGSLILPSLENSKLEIIREYLNDIYSTNLTPSRNSLEGYTNMAILIDILKKIKGLITPEKIIAEFEKIKNYNFKDLNLNFNPNSREILSSIWIDTDDNKWIEINV